MAYSFNGTNQYLTTNNNLSFSNPITISCWVNLVTNTGFPTLVSIQGANAYTDSIILFIRADLTLCLACAGGPLYQARQSVVAATGTWFHAAGVVSSVSSRTVYYNYSNSGTNTSTIGVPSLSRVVVGADFGGGAWEGFMNGSIAEVGIWNAALTNPEILSLSRGISCRNIRPQNISFYSPLIRNLSDMRQAQNISLTNNNSATVSNHPRIYL